MTRFGVRTRSHRTIPLNMSVFHAHASVLVMGRARSSALRDPGVDAMRT